MYFYLEVASSAFSSSNTFADLTLVFEGGKEVPQYLEFWLYSDYISIIFCIHFDYILIIFLSYLDYILDI